MLVRGPGRSARASFLFRRLFEEGSQNKENAYYGRVNQEECEESPEADDGISKFHVPPLGDRLLDLDGENKDEHESKCVHKREACDPKRHLGRCLGYGIDKKEHEHPDDAHHPEMQIFVGKVQPQAICDFNDYVVEVIDHFDNGNDGFFQSHPAFTQYALIIAGGEGDGY